MVKIYKDLSSGSTPSQSYPHGFQAYQGISAQSMTPWYNKQTGQEWTASNTGFSNPDPNWVTGNLPDNWTKPVQQPQPTQQTQPTQPIQPTQPTQQFDPSLMPWGPPVRHSEAPPLTLEERTPPYGFEMVDPRPRDQQTFGGGSMSDQLSGAQPWINKVTGEKFVAPASPNSVYWQNPDPNWVKAPRKPGINVVDPSVGAMVGSARLGGDSREGQLGQTPQESNIMPTQSSIQQPIDTRYQGLLGQTGQQVNAPTLPASGVQQPIQIDTITPEELRVAPLINAPQQTATEPIDSTQFSTPIPTEQAPAQVSGATARDITEVEPVTQAVLGQINTEDLIGDVTGQLSSGALAQAQTEALDEKATVQFQLGELYKSLDEGTQLPAWAAPNARKVDQFMLQRGLGASSMAAAARTQALMESALPIAAADADKYSAIQLQNLNNKQTAALQNASEVAAMDRANLDVRMKSAQQNAASFLQMNLANVTNDQATNNINHQARMQELFSDVASLNAARNFNATSQNQVDQFYATLGNQVQQANEAREAAVQQFNVQTDSSQQQFNSTLKQNRNKFNSEMQNLIDSSNVSWRRQITTYNNQLANQAQQANTRNLLGISESRQNQLWQAYRDEAVWANQSFENEEHRQQALTLAALAFNRSVELADKSSDNNTNQLIGAFGTRFLDKVDFSDIGNLFSGA